jgi:peptide deformylase
MILVERFPAVRIGYYDINGQMHDEIYQGFQAQVIQHEYNHIEGIPEEVVETTYKLPPARKINRNDKCSCGSGKKYKQCCIIYEEKL